MHRLLMAGRGSGGFAGAPAAFVRYPSNPVLTDATQPVHSAQEISVFYNAGSWKATYRAGWHTSTCAVNYATSSDGITWTGYGSNPVLGRGGSGFAGNIVQPCTFLIGSTYYCYFNDSSQLKHVYTSSDLITWTSAGSITISLPSGMTWWGNCYVWKEGSTWLGLFESGASGTNWRMHYYTSSDGLSWSVQNGGTQLSTLQISSGAAYGGPHMFNGGAKINGRYQLWYHASPSSALSNGNLPTDAYHASSTDLINWTVNGPILTHLGSPSYEVEQIADTCPIEAAGTSWLFYSGVDDTGAAASIGLAQYAGPLANLST